MEKENEQMDVFKTWMKEQKLSAQAVDSIMNDLNKIQHDFCEIEAYRYLFTTTETKIVLKIIKNLKNNKFFMMKNCMSKFSLSRSLDMYLKFVKYNEKYLEKNEQLDDQRLTKNNRDISQNSNEIKYKKVLKRIFFKWFQTKFFPGIQKI